MTENTLRRGKISDEELRRSLEDEGQGWVAEVEGIGARGHIVGFAIGLNTGNVWALFVRPEAQAHGIGTQLHADMLRWFAAQPVQRLWLCTGAETRARRFYEARGWRYAGQYGSDEVRLERPNPAD